MWVVPYIPPVSLFQILPSMGLIVSHLILTPSETHMQGSKGNHMYSRLILFPDLKPTLIRILLQIQIPFLLAQG